MKTVVNYSVMFCLLGMACTKDHTLPSVKDYDGNVYRTVRIGTQTWMVGNLKTTHLNDGTALSSLQTNDGWVNANTSAYCWQNNDLAKKEPYGALYNWHAVTTGKLAPLGWHVASKEEWEILIEHLGGKFVAATKLKESGKAHWGFGDDQAHNSIGFSAVGAGSRNSFNGEFDLFHERALFWTSTELDNKKVFIKGLLDGSGAIFEQEYPKNYGLSVRCIKD